MKRPIVDRQVSISMLLTLLFTLSLPLPGAAQQKETNSAPAQHKAAAGAQAASAATPSPEVQSASRLLPIIGKGTVNFIPLWTNNYVIGNSIVSQSGGTLNIGGGVSARTFTGDGSTLTNVNAASLGGLGSAAFAQTAAANTFTADQTINGNLNFTGSANSSLILQGNLTDTTGEQSANVIGGYPGNIVDPGVIGATIAGGGGIFNPAPRAATRGNKKLPGRGDRNTSQPNQREEDANVPPVPILQPNHVAGNAGSIGGGINNLGQLVGATIGGGANNVAWFYATVGGGNSNTAGGDYSTVAGGQSNNAHGQYSTVAGGQINSALGQYSSVGGGNNNVANGAYSSVAGGQVNTALGDFSSVGGGEGNGTAGIDATVPGGNSNEASGNSSFAAGTRAIAVYDGSFVWSDGQNVFGRVEDTGPDQFVAEAIGGFFFYTDANGGGATLPSGSGSWSSLSDRNAKANFAPVDSSSLLEKLAELPISTWNYRSQSNSIRHLGPTAQDFQAAFGLGEDDKHISNVDSEGVALAAVQALYKQSQEKDQKIAELTQSLNEKARDLEELGRRLATLEALVNAKH